MTDGKATLEKVRNGWKVNICTMPRPNLIRKVFIRHLRRLTRFSWRIFSINVWEPSNRIGFSISSSSSSTAVRSAWRWISFWKTSWRGWRGSLSSSYLTQFGSLKFLSCHFNLGIEFTDGIFDNCRVSKVSIEFSFIINRRDRFSRWLIKCLFLSIQCNTRTLQSIAMIKTIALLFSHRFPMAEIEHALLDDVHVWNFHRHDHPSIPLELEDNTVELNFYSATGRTLIISKGEKRTDENQYRSAPVYWLL